jgi:hypothetical protein
VSGRRFGRGAARVVGASVLSVGAAFGALLYDYVFSISAGLCGDSGSHWPTVLAIAVPLVVIGSWGVLHGNWIYVAWPAAVLSAAACVVLVDYVDPGAHGYCETMTPYERSSGPFVRYSTMSIAIVSPPLAKVAFGPSKETVQPSSSLL